MAANLHLASDIRAPRRAARSASPISILLADDHASVRRSLRLLLDCEVDLEVIAEATELATVIRYVGDEQPRVLVLDVRLPDGSGTATIRRLRAEFPQTEIVVLTMQESAAFAQQAMDAGAIGFVLKDRADTELLSAIRRAAHGEEYVSDRVAAGLEALRRLA